MKKTLGLLALLWPVLGWGGEEGSVPVTVRPLAELLLHPQARAPATVISLNDARLGAEVAGVVGEVVVEAGSRVQPGDPLIVLDGWEHRLAVAQAEAALATLQAQRALAGKQVARASVLRQKGQAAEELLDTRSTEVEVLEAQVAQQQSALATARQRLAKGTVRAPFAGVVVERLAQRGQWVNPGEPLVRLVDLERLELVAEVAPDEAESLTGAGELFFQQETGSHPARLRLVLPWQDAQGRTRQARLTFPASRPLPGSAGRLVWSDPRPHLPPWLLVRRDGGLGVFFLQEGRARFQPIPEAREGQPAPLPGGWQGNVILDGREGLADGDGVRVGEPAAAQTGPGGG